MSCPSNTGKKNRYKLIRVKQSEEVRSDQVASHKLSERSKVNKKKQRVLIMVLNAPWMWLDKFSTKSVNNTVLNMISDQSLEVRSDARLRGSNGARTAQQACCADVQANPKAQPSSHVQFRTNEQRMKIVKTLTMKKITKHNSSRLQASKSKWTKFQSN